MTELCAFAGTNLAAVLAIVTIGTTLRTAGADIARGTITTSVRLTAVGAIFTGAFGFAFVTIVTVRTYFFT